MKERGIVMSGDSVRAILAGTKTQTRRLLRLPSFDRVGEIVPSDGGSDLWDAHDTTEPDFPRRMVWHSIECPCGVPGDRLYCKEVWATSRDYDGVPLREAGFYERDPVYFAADSPEQSLTHGRWRSPFHLPRWASRLTLELTEVRVQRLQEISEEDAKAEGMRRNEAGIYVGARNSPWTTAGAAFFSLWDHINGKRAPWESNPFVWALTFRRVE